MVSETLIISMLGNAGTTKAAVTTNTACWEMVDGAAPSRAADAAFPSDA